MLGTIDGTPDMLETDRQVLTDFLDSRLANCAEFSSSLSILILQMAF